MSFFLSPSQVWMVLTELSSLGIKKISLTAVNMELFCSLSLSWAWVVLTGLSSLGTKKIGRKVDFFYLNVDIDDYNG